MAGAGLGLAIVGLISLFRQVSKQTRKLTKEAAVDEVARSRMDAEGGAMQPMPTHVH